MKKLNLKDGWYRASQEIDIILPEVHDKRFPYVYYYVENGFPVGMACNKRADNVNSYLRCKNSVGNIKALKAFESTCGSLIDLILKFEPHLLLPRPAALSYDSIYELDL